MRNFIDILSTPDHVLLEAQQYDAMFGQIMKLAQMKDVARHQRYNGTDTSDMDDDIAQLVRDRGDNKFHEYTDDCEENIAHQIGYAKRKLKKSDRIIWYLRFARLKMIMNFKPNKDYKSHPAEQASNDFANALYQKYMDEYVRGNGGESDFDVSLMEVQHDLEHYLSLPIPEIQNYVFNRQSYQEIYGDFRRAERAWQEERKHGIPINDTDETVLVKRIGADQWEWVHLDRAYCQEEGDAMGHCGNSPRSSSSDTILSLRKRVSRPGMELWKPYATFILRENGELTEMKGRFNNKPGADGEHDAIMAMIVELLKLPIIKGMVGGGHAAHNNFALSDLADKQREELIDSKPTLADAVSYYLRFGYDEIFAKKLENELAGIASYIEEVNDSYAVLSKWKSVANLTNSLYFDASGGMEKVVGFVNYDFRALRLDSTENFAQKILTKPDFDEFDIMSRVEVVDNPEPFKSARSEIVALTKYLREKGADDFLEKLWRKVSALAEKYYIQYINEMNFTISGGNPHFVVEEGGEVELRVDTQSLTAGLALNNGYSPEEVADDLFPEIGYDFVTIGDTYWASIEINEDAELKYSPDEFVEKISALVDKALIKYISKL